MAVGSGDDTLNRLLGNHENEGGLRGTRLLEGVTHD